MRYVPTIATALLLAATVCASSSAPARAASGIVGDAHERDATAATVPLLVRVRGLALGNTLELTRAGVRLTADLNDEYLLSATAVSGSSLDLQVTRQPRGQHCALSAQAPSSVPADSAPVFVRCRSTPGEPVVVPATLPDQPLRVLFGADALRRVAYPGIPYESRLGVVGGTFPYTFSLVAFTIDGAAADSSDVELDYRRGTLRYTPAAAGTFGFTIRIRDSAATPQVLTQSFTLQSAIAPFVFVAPDGEDAAGRGSLALPYRTPAYALARTTADQVVVLRKGVYDVAGGLAIGDARAKQFLAYPDEVPTLDLNHAGRITVRVEQVPPARFEGLDISRVLQYGFFSDPSKSGLVIRNIRFVDGREGSTPSENPAFIHAYGDSPTTPRHRLLVQDSDFGAFEMLSAGAYALTLFDAGDSLVENNQLRLGAAAGGIHEKDNSQGNTHRENYIAFASSNATNRGIHVSAQGNSANIHIHHNLLINAGIRLGLQCYQETCYMRNHDVHHNTLVGVGVLLSWGVFNPTSSGTRVVRNIISSAAATPYAWHSCLRTLPAQFGTQLVVGANLIETGNALAARDTECGGSAPMNMNWQTWRDTHGMDNVASGSVVTATSALTGTGPTVGLPSNDARRPQLGHLYLTDAVVPDLIFANGFD